MSALPAGVRPFTAPELARIREIVSDPFDSRGFPRRMVSDELDAITAATGSRRGFKAWELDRPSEHDPERAYREEVDQ